MTNADNHVVGKERGAPEAPGLFVYRRVFAYGSLQFCGHIEEYLAAHTAELMMFIVQPRVGPHVNILRRYQGGSLVEERSVKSSQNVFLYYLLWYANHARELLRFCPKGEKTLVLGGHPVVFFGMRLFKAVRSLVYAYWIGDYFPSAHPVIRVYERVKKGYHDRVSYAFYLSDAINRVMNGRVVQEPCRRTVMWGLKPYPAATVPPLTPFSLLFVGLIRPGQGLETLFEFLAQHPEYRLSLIGVGPSAYVSELQGRMSQKGLSSRVFFPNRFYSENELLGVARTCHVGIAMYDTRQDNFTHYADPGKVKAYAELGLPVLMTRISDIVPFVERFRSGEVIDRVDQMGVALERIRLNYRQYQEGLAQFNAHFAYACYYRESFKVLEACWR
jgi:glycosyltransferase involved in cell wall biosynthesis